MERLIDEEELLHELISCHRPSGRLSSLPLPSEPEGASSFQRPATSARTAFQIFCETPRRNTQHHTTFSKSSSGAATQQPEPQHRTAFSQCSGAPSLGDIGDVPPAGAPMQVEAPPRTRPLDDRSRQPPPKKPAKSPPSIVSSSSALEAPTTATAAPYGGVQQSTFINIPGPLVLPDEASSSSEGSDEEYDPELDVICAPGHAMIMYRMRKLLSKADKRGLDTSWAREISAFATLHEALSFAVSKIDAERARLGGCRFKVGITRDPWFRWRNRVFGYFWDRWSHMKVIWTTSRKPKCVGQLEKELITHYKEVHAPGFCNIRPGGENAPPYAPCFAYAVFGLRRD
jgi:hypothetical protein